MAQKDMLQKKNPFLTVLNSIALLILLSNWIFSLYIFPELPEKIPVHFDGAGKADSFGPKFMYFLLPALATVLYVLMTFVNRYPRFFEYAKSVTREDQHSGYAASVQLLHVMKIAVMVVLASIQILTYTTVTNRSEGLGSWFLPITLSVLLLPIFVFLLRSRLRK